MFHISCVLKPASISRELNVYSILHAATFAKCTNVSAADKDSRMSWPQLYCPSLETSCVIHRVKNPAYSFIWRLFIRRIYSLWLDFPFFMRDKRVGQVMLYNQLSYHKLSLVINCKEYHGAPLFVKNVRIYQTPYTYSRLLRFSDAP